MKELLAVLLVGSIAFGGTAYGAEIQKVDLTKCYACHGKQFDKKALGKSKIVAEMSQKDINSSLIGYQDGIYGGPLKKIMQSQLKGYDKLEILQMSFRIARDCNETVCVVKI